MLKHVYEAPSKLINVGAYSLLYASLSVPIGELKNSVFFLNIGELMIHTQALKFLFVETKIILLALCELFKEMLYA